MKKKILAFLAASAVALTSLAGCSNDKGTENSSSESLSENSDSDSENEDSKNESSKTETKEPETEPTTVHISPVETLSSNLGTQITPNKTIQRTDGSNTFSASLSEFIEDGDVIESFTFVIYSADGSDIGTFKGGCGIAVDESCSAATDKGWYQSPDFSAETQGTYGEIKWDVPAEIREHINTGGEVLFGYWWGNCESIRVDSVICTYTRTREIPVDGTNSASPSKSVNYSDTDNVIKIPASDLLPEGCVPQAVTFNISSGGSFGKFTGAFGFDSPSGHYQSADTAVFTESSSLSLTWFVPVEVKKYASSNGEFQLGYWWSQQPNVTLDSITVKYSIGNASSDSSSNSISDNTSKPKKSDDNISSSKSDNGDFRSSAEIVSEIKIGWNLGNSFDCYNYSDYATDGETAWGNPKTTEAMIKNVKDSGFNAIRIPVTWGEHMNGDIIDDAWMNRVQEVVNYAYDNGMIVILNMHHDDDIWFEPKESEYAADSARLCKIWEQICARFGNYGDRLLFEGMNEPRTVGSAAEWMGGTAPEHAVINKYEQDFVNTVRASGGNNAHRTLIVTSYAASIEDAAVNDMVVPDDDNVIVSIHYYAPWKFAFGETNEWSKSDLDSGFEKLKSKFIDKGIPVIIGEFGAVSNNNDAQRKELYEYYVSKAKSIGIKCFIWDNNVESGESSFGLFNRTSMTWNDELLQALIKGANK